MKENTSEVTITPEIMEKLDKKYPSPETRAEHIWNHYFEGEGEITNWDLLCFCVLYLRRIGAQYSWIEIPARHANRLLHIAHYKFGVLLFGHQSVSALEVEVDELVPLETMQHDVVEADRELYESEVERDENPESSEPL